MSEPLKVKVYGWGETTPAEVVQVAERQAKAGYPPDFLSQARLAHALALMVEKLADARRDSLENVAAGAKRMVEVEELAAKFDRLASSSGCSEERAAYLHAAQVTRKAAL